ncbi:putative LRR receptor-like serine/threonine-protein kinase [Ananas comosus]|uniref:non-specific serine/threonine protein kinase n=1 Tax=Ananas comosus TaxID=4615 RepID=A0A199VIF4_ANACO|nr:putative LRR receptor-like serine/threonine-protein kinase [Ananas comosus]
MLLLLQFILFFFYSQQVVSVQHNNFTDLTMLLSFKSQVRDPDGLLDRSWSSNTSFCSWLGVSCSSRRRRVVALRLDGLSLHGTISPHLGNLSFMTQLNLGNNSLGGPIPESLGRLPRLTYLRLTDNRLSGHIPSTIFNMSLLEHLSFMSNNLSGPLLLHNASFTVPRLKLFSIWSNQISGTIPSGLLQCQDLEELWLSSNQLSGSIPAEFDKLQKLTRLLVDTNDLTGTIPASLGNLTSLVVLDLHTNSLRGPIPPELGSLQNVQWLNLADNILTGGFPASILNASMVSVLSLSANNLTGSVPVELGNNLPFLTKLGFGPNQLSGRLDFITSLSSCRKLQNLYIADNQLEGSIPDSVGNLSRSFLKFNARGNRISGRIPMTLGNLSGLLNLHLENNWLTGSIPPALSNLRELQLLYLGSNSLSKSIPYELGKLKRLGQLNLEFNELNGAIPDSIGNISGLQFLRLHNNRLSSSIPRSIWSLTNLVGMYLSQNSMEGSIPYGIGNLATLSNLDLSTNRFSGSIPDAFGQLLMLTTLNISNNFFDGPIPQSFGKMISLRYLDLSSNEFSGPIPKSLADLKYLVGLNLSFNKLEGQIPSGGVFANITFRSLMGNIGLCGPSFLRIPPCSDQSTDSDPRSKQQKLKIILPTVASLVVLFSCSFFYFVLHRKSNHAIPSSNTTCLKHYSLIPYRDLLRATDNFNESNLLGAGSFGSVYRGRLDDGSLIAAKVINLEKEGSSKIFDVECQALRMIRHRNLVKVISTCSNMDFKALILEYLPNGSLEKWLYSPGYCLTLLQRINIALDVASALEYLHHHLRQVVVHCDIKPSNVLLDEDMNAQVGDFGIAKLLASDGKSVALTSAAGTVGYMPPEYGFMGRVSRRGDVYSYGILLLETFTRKKPTDRMFDGELNLRQWVSDAYRTRLFDILDANLFRDARADRVAAEEDHGMRNRCLMSVLELALQCSKDSPRDRILMKDVVPILQKIKIEYCKSFPET